MTGRRCYWPDEDVDVEDQPRDYVAEQEAAEGLCKRCGHGDHEAPACPNVDATVYRRWSE